MSRRDWNILIACGTSQVQKLVDSFYDDDDGGGIMYIWMKEVGINPRNMFNCAKTNKIRFCVGLV